MNSIIEIKNIGKKYNITHQRGGYVALRDVLMNVFKSPFSFLKTKAKRVSGFEKKEEFWALKDVNLTVQKGEVVGIIGANGAGKSTLLKILSQITPPTEGEVILRGRVGSLLEVGTGFHPELTGRENIFLNGAILGMKKKEIAKKFDELVEFAGIGKFLDTPVKYYSSGMYVRLAFSVAAHMEPDILIIDEVLAVGDAEFQKKCLGKMDDISKKDGRTILFVSHNLEAIKKLCSRGLLLKNGTVEMEGEVESLIAHYIGNMTTQKSFTPFKIQELNILVTKIALNAERSGIIVPFQPLQIDIELEAERDIDTVGIQLMIYHGSTSSPLFVTNTKTTHNIDIKIRKGKNTITCLIENLAICAGTYWLGFGVDVPFVRFYYHAMELISFTVPEIIAAPRLVSNASSYGQVYLTNTWAIKN